MLGLQRTVGNRAVGVFLAAAQPKLTVGAADDAYERQADAIADEVVGLLRSGDRDEPLEEPKTRVRRATLGRLQRRVAPPPAAQAPDVGLDGGILDQGAEAEIGAARAHGTPLPPRLRRSMEGAFGADFGGVHVHRGAASEALNRKMGAKAFTVGHDIFLGPGTGSLEHHATGQRLLAHELAHTIQQGASSPVVQRDVADERKARYDELEGDQGKWAKRTEKEASGFTDKALESTFVAKALSMPRKPDGSLSDEALALMDAKSVSDAKEMITDKYKSFGVEDKRSGFFKDSKLKTELAKPENLNKLSGKTKYPELNNILSPTKAKVEDTTESRAVGGVKMDVTYNKSDVNADARLALLSTAVEKVQTAGFKVPSLDVQVPKWSRKITIKPDCTISEGLTTSAAQFAAPRLMHLGAGGLANPQEELEDKRGGAKGEKEPKFMSAKVDLSGAGTVVHELGHAIHYATNPSGFHSLHFTTFKKGAPNAKVSGYATNPREFVAEVFTGIVYGKSFDDDVMEMYFDLGGPTNSTLEAKRKKSVVPSSVPVPSPPAPTKV